MNTFIILLEKRFIRSGAANTLMVLAALLVFWAPAGQAGQSSGRFDVAINLQSSGGAPATAPTTVLCRSGSGIGAFGSTLTVNCATGTIAGVAEGFANLPWTSLQESSYRYLLNVYQEGRQLGSVESNIGAGTVTSWRLIKLNHQDYLEMMLHW